MERQDTEPQEMRRIARRRAATKFGFMIHLTMFVAVNALLFFVNQRTSPGMSWFAFPLGGWGVGLAIHGFAVFVSASGLKERMVEGEMRRLRAQGGPGAH